MNQRQRQVQHGRVAVFYTQDLPNMATHVAQEECGFSVYQGILIQWDEDHDTRILEFIDTLNDYERRNLAVVQEHEGTIAFLWNKQIPLQFVEGGTVNVVGDSWRIVSSRVISYE